MTKRNNTVPLAEVIRLYRDENWTAQAIAGKYGLNYQTILRWLREAGVTRRSGGVHSSAPLDRKTLTRLYIDQGLTIKRTAEQLRCSHVLVASRMKEFGIKPRSRGYY